MKKIIKLILLSILLAAFSGCASFDLGSLSPTTARSAGGGENMTISGLSNNTEIHLEAGTYKGLTITHNSVVLTGQGSGKTIIEGNVLIKGNSCVIRNLTIRGDVIIEGNNADLEKSQIQGEVNSTGKNNNW